MTNHTNQNRTLTIKSLNVLQIKARSVQDQYASLLVTYKARLEHTPLKSTVHTPDIMPLPYAGGQQSDTMTCLLEATS
jgi:hypothetical protein